MYICDMVNPETGKTWREENAAKKHNIPVGALVEIIDTGVRLFVVQQQRDCDETPLYELCADRGDTVVEHDGFKNRKWHGGYPEDSLIVIRDASL